MRDICRLTYKYQASSMEDMQAKRAPLREKHLEWARVWHERGLLVAGGAFGELSPSMGGMLLFGA